MEEKINISMPRPEFPDPQLRRENWLNLNGEWEFEIDFTGEKNSHSERTFQFEHFDKKIIVPFAPESDLSGIGYKGFMDAVLYRRDLKFPASFDGKRKILHFGAVDHKATVYVNGKLVGTHAGGYWPFSFDITDYLTGEGDYLTVLAEDDIRNGKYGAGKQAPTTNSRGCHYTRTTGIWQTVWVEAVEAQHVDFFRLTPVIERSVLAVELNTSRAEDVTLIATAGFDGKIVGEKTVSFCCGHVAFDLELSELHLWDLGQGNLYDLKFTLKSGETTLDEVYSYFGMRSVALRDGKFYLNGRSVFGRFVLDQGFYRDGIYTAPDTSRFDEDVRLSMEMGFNGARFHEKVFEPLALYAADKAGYMVWDEYPDWNIHNDDFTCLEEIIPDWLSEIRRDYNHPSIIGWGCLNETWDRIGAEGRRFQQDNRMLDVLYRVVKSQDNMRPVIDTSGNFHVVTDTFDIHCYEQDPEKFKKYYEEADGLYVNFPDRQKYNGTPYWVSEYGGIKMPGDEAGWGYGNTPKNREEFLSRYKGLTDVLLDNPKCWALCYTQLYDVEQEVNGLYFYDRSDKFTAEEKKFLRAVMERKAAVEK